MIAGLALTARAAPLITDIVDESTTVTIKGERSPHLDAAIDHGVVEEGHVMSHVRMVLKRSPEMQAKFDKLVRDQQDPASPSFHKWLSPADLRSYGPAQEDIEKTVAWLKSHGMKVNKIARSGMSIEFATSAKAAGEAFHTELHNVELSGTMHLANTSDLAIPVGLGHVIRGVTLSNFFPKPNMVRAKPNLTFSTTKNTYYAVAPGDFATIYGLNQLRSPVENYFGALINGAGSTVAVVEQTDIQPADWLSFRKQFGLSGFQGTLTLTHPGGCGDPGFTGDEDEAALDAEWASATAPDAAIIEASCPGFGTTFGVETALQELVELGTPADVFSISYGGAEAANGLTFLAGWEDLVEMGASEGKTIIVSTGDGGVSSSTGALGGTGIAVNGLSSNAYVTALGGTDFYDTALGEIPKYWGNAHSNTATLSSAKSYIPEIPWDNSCASSIIVKYLKFANSIASCNSSATHTGFPHEQPDVGGTGGPSILYSKPDFQAIGVPGVPDDGVRDQPDVSLFASNGSWSHFYIYCMSDVNEGGTACDFTKTADLLGNAAGGTSFSAPAFAGIMALVVQVKGFDVGNAAPRLYQLAQLQFNSSLLAKTCNSTLGSAISTFCVFNDVTAGNNAEPCVAFTVDCYSPATATKGVGVLREPGSNTDAFPAHQGYDLATGLGSVNVPNLLYNY